MMVSLFPQIKATTGGTQLEIEQVLAGIQAGKWQREAEAVRRATSKTEYRQLKNAAPYFTVSGTFAKREDAGLLQHSGLVALDLDKEHNPSLDVVADKVRLAADPYTYACFTSIGGAGLCCLIRIPTDNHAGSWASLAGYYLKTYELRADPACKDVSRPRFVSYDPALFVNPAADVWEDVEAEPAPKASPPPREPHQQQRPTGEGYGPQAISRAVNKVLDAPEGQKHYVLNKMAFLLGGVAASGFISEEEARQALRGAIGSREVADLKGAFKTIEDGLAAGRLKPALPHELHYHVHSRLRDGGTAETIGASIAASEGLPQDNIVAAVEDIAAEKRNEVHLLTFWDLVEGPKRDAPLKLVLSLTKFGKWLGENGFRQRSLGEKTQLVRLDGHIVRPVVRSGLKAFVLDYVEELPFTFDGIYRSVLEEQVRRQHVSLFEQALWHACLRAQGYRVEVIRSLPEFIALLTDYLS
ncbi:MAG: BT4734/BF3469 family protein [Janthinobacterium lividum]